MGFTNALRRLLVRTVDPQAASLYSSCVTAARQPKFYAELGVPDSLDGRFDLLLLFALLTMMRMKDAKAKQRLFDLMFADMERSLREMGVGDMSIGKKMKPMLAGFYGRAGAYEQALAESTDDKLIAALSRNLYGLKSGTADDAPTVASYIRLAVAKLAEQSDAELDAGRIVFPSP